MKDINENYLQGISPNNELIQKFKEPNYVNLYD